MKLQSDFNVLIIGVGGTGGNVAAMLSRFLPNQYEMWLMDGDKVEEKNLERQPFQEHDVNEFKAESLARKISTATTTKCNFINSYLTRELQLNFLRKSRDLFIISCVDNHPARIIIEKWIKQNYNGFHELTYIDSANELKNGEIISSHFEKGRWGGPSIGNIKYRSDIWPNIKKSKKGDRSQKSCAVEISKGNTQQYATNYQAATIIFNQVFNVFKKQKINNLITFDLENNKMGGRDV